MIRTNEYERIREQTLKELDAMLESGGDGLAVWHLMYIQDKPERKYYPLIEASLRRKKNRPSNSGSLLSGFLETERICAAFATVGRKGRRGKKCDAGDPYVSIRS